MDQLMDDAIQAQYTAFEKCVEAWMHEQHQEDLAYELRRMTAIQARTPLEYALLEAGWSQDRAARVLGVSQPTLSRMVSGKQTLTVGRAQLLADRLGVDYRTLLPEVAGAADAAGPKRETFQRFVLGMILGGWPDASVQDVAASVGLAPKDIEAWANGDLVLPVETCESMVRTWLPGRRAEFGLG